MTQPYFPLVIDPTFPGSNASVARRMSCPTFGAGLAYTLPELTVVTWLCTDGGAFLNISAQDSPLTTFFSEQISAGGHDLGSNTAYGMANSNGYPLPIRQFYNPANPVLNTAPGDGYNYKSGMMLMIKSYRWIDRVVQCYMNDTPGHNVLYYHGGGVPLNNSRLPWQMDLFGASRSGYGPIWITDRFIDFDVEANRRQFINADLSAVALPSDGHIRISGETVLPVCYFRVLDGGSPSDFAVNNGTGPPWTMTPASPALKFGQGGGRCLTSIFIGTNDPPPVLPPPIQATTNSWTLEPDWNTPITETLAWKTDVITSQRGYEQRRRLRTAPRRVIEASFTLFGANRRLYDSYMTGPAMGHWIYPMWWEKLLLTGPAEIGDIVLNCDTRNSEIVAGSLVILIGETPFINETMEVYSVTPWYLTLVTPLKRDWPRASSVYLARACHLVGEQRSTRQADNAAQVTLRFETVEPNDFTGVAPPVVRAGYPVLHLFPDEAQDMSVEFRRVLAEFDNEVSALSTRIDQAGQPFTLQQFTWFAYKRTELKALRGLLYYLQGRLVPIWVPTYANDVEVLPGAVCAADDNTLIVSRSGYSDFTLGDSISRNTLQIRLRGGVTLYYEVLSSQILNDTTEAMTLLTQFGTDFNTSDIIRASFIALSRQDQDEIEITHHADASGVSTVTTTFATILAGRVADTYEPDIYTGEVAQDNAPVAPPVDEQVNDPIIVLEPDVPVDPGSGGGGGPE